VSFTCTTSFTQATIALTHVIPMGTKPRSTHGKKRRLHNQTLDVTGTGRYLRLYGTARATQYGYSLWELQVHGG
jgi:hypothetical protein